MRRLLTVAVATMLTAGALATTFAPAVDAAPVFQLVDGSSSDQRFMVGASDDGRMVLTESLSFGGTTAWRVIDTVTGTVHQLSYGTLQPRLSGDGRRIVVATTTALDPGDTDLLLDVYSIALADRSDVVWLSPGWDTYEVSPMAVDSTGLSAVVRGSSVTLLTAQILHARPSGMAPLTRPSTNLAVHGMSADGDLVLFSEYDDCSPSPACLVYRLKEYRRSTGQVSERTVVVDGVARQVFWLVADASGTCLAFTALGVPGVWRQCRGQTAEQLTTQVPNNGPYQTCPALDISADGRRVAWLASTPSTYRGDVVDLPQPYVMEIGGTPVLQTTTAPGAVPAGIAHCVQLADTGAVLVMTLDDLVPGSELGVTRVLARSDGAPSSSTTAPSTTAPSTTTPTSTTPTSTTAPTPSTAPATTAPTTTLVGSGGPVPGGASAFTARTPVRILDTRTGLGAPAGLPAAATRITIPVRGQHGVPADATAVAVQLTATDGTAAGYVSLVPDASQLGRSSNLNIDTPGETIANAAIVPIGADGTILLYTMSPTHLIVDLAGWWTPTADPVAAGRFRPVGPARVLDTRPDTAIGSAGVKPTAGQVTTVQITGRPGIPATGVSAVVLNITIDAPESLGFIQAAPAATLTPGTSSTLNVGRPGQVIAASTIVPVDAQGRIAIYTQPSTHLIVDVAGWFTDGTATPGTDGLFVAGSGGRYDTRAASLGAPRLPAGTRYDIPASGGAIVGNIAVTDTAGPGFVQLGPSDTMVNGATSNINPTRAEETVANAFIVPTGSGGRMGVYTSNATHIVIDVTGYMTA